MAGVDLSFGGNSFPRSAEVRMFLYQNAMQGLSPRFRALDRYDAFYKCLEHQHQSVDWTGQFSADQIEAISPGVMTPQGFTQPAAAAAQSILQRRPSAPLRLARMVVDRFTGLLFSEDRTPTVTVEGDEEADEFLRSVFKAARFWRTMYLARTMGGSMGSALVTVSLKNGRFAYRAHSPKIVHDIVWEDSDLKRPQAVLIQYTFFREVEVLDEKTGAPTGETRQIPHLYRRIIDDEYDVVFKPARLDGAKLPMLEIDTRRTYRHKLGRFPGVWIQNLPEDEGFDGVPDCEGAYQMFDVLDRLVAQQNKALIYNMDPTLTVGRDPMYDRLNQPLKTGSDNALNVGKGGFAQYLEITGGGITSADTFIDKIRQAAMDLCQCVLVDPEKVSGAAQSAKAIEFLYGPMLEKAGRLREQYGEAIGLLGEITLELARKWADPSVYPGRTKPRFDLPLKVVERQSEVEEGKTFVEWVTPTPGVGGQVSLQWGPFFPETPQDKQLKVGNITALKAGGLIDLETAVRNVAPMVGVDDVQDLVEKVTQEAEKARKQAMEQMGAGLTMEEDLGEGEEFEQGDEPDEETKQAVDEEAKAQGVQLNGAQIASASKIVLQVSEGAITPEQGVQLITFLGVPEVAARRLIGTDEGE